MARVIRAEGAILRHIIARAPVVAYGGLSREAFVKHEAAQARTAWALHHRRRFALMEGNEVLASAERYNLTGRLDRALVTSGGIGSVLDSGPAGAGLIKHAITRRRLLAGLGPRVRQLEFVIAEEGITAAA